MLSFNYDKDTRLKYQDKEFAKRYKETYTTHFSFMKLITQRVKECVQKALAHCSLTANNIILDMPCGTGVMANTLRYKGNIIAGDISMEMMNLALEDYKGNKFYGFIQGDATEVPFKNKTFGLVVNIGLMHRVPIDIKRRVLKEMARISNQYIIISFSITSYVQKLKLTLIKIFIRNHNPSPCPVAFKELKSEIEETGVEIIRVYRVFPFLSSQVILLLRKKNEIVEF